MGSVAPSGHGVYARAQSVDWLARFDWIAVNAARFDARDVAIALKASRHKVYLTEQPGSWHPENALATLDRLVFRAQAWNVDGVIVDAESGWGGVAPDALAHAMVRASSKTSIGFTSYPLWPGLRSLAAIAGPSVWGSPQIYHEHPARVMQSWFATWKELFSDAIPSITLWRNDVSRTDREYAAYLAKVPSAHGYIGWTTDQTPDSMVRAYRALGLSLTGSTTSWLRRNWLQVLASIAILLGVALIPWALRSVS